MIEKFLRRLFGGGEVAVAADEAAAGEPGASDTEDYKGFRLSAAPVKEKGGWRVAGRVSRDAGATQQTHDFSRADTFPSRDDAVQVTLRKARLIVDERGARLFD